MMSILEFTQQMNEWGHMKVPFLFMVDFEMKKPRIIKLSAVLPSEIQYNINGFTNAYAKKISQNRLTKLSVQPTDFDEYKRKFEWVYQRLCYGDSFLTNLTIKTPIELGNPLHEIFHLSKARYKLFMPDNFLVFSPEIFIQIKAGKIYSYPMKGTLDSSVPNAADVILDHKKERAEHTTIVDLIRNDLSQVATHVQVARFRYLEEIKTSHKNLLHVSSEIVGQLPSDYRSRLGNILVALLPAGSISGAPKTETLKIIEQVEGEPRGYYTGIFGYFDGDQLDSGVMIRFIEKEGEHYFYRSGGGITTQSNVTSEYQETLDKVYVPVD